jgi:hypothetical protein
MIDGAAINSRIAIPGAGWMRRGWSGKYIRV